jgi:hypothetical protein
MSWLDEVQYARSLGLTDKEIMEGMGMKSTEFRARMTMERSADKLAKIDKVEKLHAKDVSNMEISRQTGIPESTVRTLLAANAREKAEALLGTANMLKDEVARKTYVDVGEGVENHLGISKEKLKASVEILKQQGYVTHPVKVPQLGTRHETTIKVLCPPGTTQHTAWLNRLEIQQLDSFSIDGGKKYTKQHDPISIDPKRVAVRYKEEGGHLSDGVIYIRPGVKDLSMGSNNYAQVRIKVGDGHYLKGMAVFKDDLPAGVDIVFNTNKSDTGNKLDAMKPLKIDKATGKVDMDLPFGALVRNVTEVSADGKEVNVSALNIVNGEGAWKDWSKSMSTQLLSKQKPQLIRQQLDKTFEERQKQYDEIMSLTNPTVRKKLLKAFADETDAAAVHLEAASINAESRWHVILPVENMRPTEVYAPNYENGTRVALIRYPHGGPFEIPELTVNNRHQGAKKMIGKDSVDAIGIHPDVAGRLSGADFDGDTVIVIPNNSGKIKSQPALDGLADFDPKALYKMDDSRRGIRDCKNPTAQTGKIMGEASNLITDMTIRGASPDKIARAVKYSMVTIDAEKHHLDYAKAKRDFGIQALKDEFQVDPANPTKRGASTLISRARAEILVDETKPRSAREGGPIDPATGKLMMVPSGRTRKLEDGTRVPRQVKVERLAVTDDAHTLSTGHPIEKMYADHSNRLKAMANSVRKDWYETPRLQQSRTAKKVYAEQVQSLSDKLHNAQLNAPRERQAQVIANATVRAKRQANKHLDKEQIKRLESQALTEARKRTGAGKQRIEITDIEWEAIQAGAVSDSRLSDILLNTDIEEVKKLATPKPDRLMTSGRTARAKAMLASGDFSQAEVARALGVSLTTLKESLK